MIILQQKKPNVELSWKKKIVYVFVGWSRLLSVHWMLHDLSSSHLISQFLIIQSNFIAVIDVHLMNKLNHICINKSDSDDDSQCKKFYCHTFSINNNKIQTDKTNKTIMVSV